MQEKYIPLEELKNEEEDFSWEKQEGGEENSVINKEEAPKREEVAEKKIDVKSRLKNGWDKIKQKFKESSKKNAKRAVVLSSIALTMLSASEGMSLTNKDFADMFGSEGKKYELSLGDEALRKLEIENYGEVFKHAEEIGQEIEPKRITAEFNLLNSVSEVLNEQFDSKNKDGGDFDLAGRARNQIEAANENFERIINCDKEEAKKFKADFFEGGRINWQALVKAFPMVWGMDKAKLIAHEIGHREEYQKQGAKADPIKLNLAKLMDAGYSKYKGTLKNPEVGAAAGIEMSNKIGNFIIDGLKSSDQNNQMLSLLALMCRMEGSLYAIKTASGLSDSPGNDLKIYNEETGISIDELTLGLVGNFILNSDNWKLIKMALGDDNIKFSDKFWKCYYKLAEGGPEVGVKAGINF